MCFLGFPHGLCEVKTVQKYLVNQKLSFPVAPKSETTLSIRETLYVSKETILITALLAVGSTLVNPLGVVSAAWLVTTPSRRRSTFSSILWARCIGRAGFFILPPHNIWLVGSSTQISRRGHGLAEALANMAV